MVTTQNQKIKELMEVFFKLGATAFGGPAAHVAAIQIETIEKRNWLSQEHLLRLYGLTNILPGPNSTELVVAIGQVTPGPLFTTATFVGYLLAGHGGAIAATIGIFLPGFLAMAIFHPQLEKWQRSPWLRDFLAGIEPATWGLMAAVGWQLVAALSGWPSYGIALASLLILLKKPGWSLGLLAIGGLAGSLFQL